MKNSDEIEGSRITKAARLLAGFAGFLSLGILVWAACGCLAAGIANETRGSRGGSDWYHRCRVEVRQLISIVNYLLTPEDDLEAITSFVAPALPVLPALSELIPNWATGAVNVGIAPDNTDRH